MNAYQFINSSLTIWKDGRAMLLHTMLTKAVTALWPRRQPKISLIANTFLLLLFYL